MKRVLFVIGLCASAAGLGAAQLDVVEVGTPAINFLYATNGTLLVDDTNSPITLPGGTGTGFLHSRVITAGPASPAQGLYGYEYRIDLTGITAPNTEPCFTNLIHCVTNTYISYGMVRSPFTNGAGRVIWHMARVPLATNHVTRCTTNIVRCPDTAPCIQALRIKFGRVVKTLDFDTNGTLADNVYVVTNGPGSIAPTSVIQDEGVLTLRFTNAICPGSSSYIIGLVSSNAPSTVQAALSLTGGGVLLVDARAPARPPITCDFSVLKGLIDALGVADINAPNDNAAQGRIAALQNRITLAMDAAQQGNVEEVLDELMGIGMKAGERSRNTWVKGSTADHIRAAVSDLLDCVQGFEDEEHGTGD